MPAKKDRRRALRRHHRDRVIAKRLATVRAMDLGRWSKFPRPTGQLADAQSWLGCNRPRCGVCHPGKRPGYADRQRAREAWQREWINESP